MKVYITKFALECGILEREVNSPNEYGSVYIENSPYDNNRWACKGEWFTNRQEAIDKVYEMRADAIKALQLKIEQLLCMKID